MSDEIKQAIEALKPFAKMANGWIESMPDDTSLADYNYGYDEDGCVITLGDCRRAREAATALAALDTAPTPSPDQIKREALTLIERLYCIEGKDAEWRAERMNSVAREAQSPEPNLSRFHRIFPRSVFTGGDDE